MILIFIKPTVVSVDNLLTVKTNQISKTNQQ